MKYVRVLVEFDEGQDKELGDRPYVFLAYIPTKKLFDKITVECGKKIDEETLNSLKEEVKQAILDKCITFQMTIVEEENRSF